MKYTLIIILFTLTNCKKKLETSQKELNLIVDGNSYPQGNGFKPFADYITTHYPCNSNTTLHNFAMGGQSTIDMLSDEASQVFTAYEPGMLNIYLPVEIGNDIYFNGSAIDAFNRYKLLCTNARNKGFKVIAYTNPHRNQYTSYKDNPTLFNIKIDSANTMLRNDSSFYDYLVDIASLEQFSSYDLGYYATDMIHPNQQGQDLYGVLTDIGIVYLIRKYGSVSV